MADDDGRRRHYADLYEPSADDGPVGVVLGNCQAESLRQALEGIDVRLLRVPPVHELVADDVPHLQRALARAAVVVAQPIRDDYHGLPLGTRQLFAAAPAGARTAVLPVIRDASAYPWHAIVRPPSDPGATPPLVAYHDLRTLSAAAGRPTPPVPSADALRAIGAASLEELRSREQRHGTVPVSDLLAEPSFERMRTINHPGNAVWEPVAQRVHETLGTGGAPRRLSRALLDAVHAPREAAVIDLLGIDAEPREHWIVDGRAVDRGEVREAHLAWYREHPDAVRAGLERHAAALGALGL